MLANIYTYKSTKARCGKVTERERNRIVDRGVEDVYYQKIWVELK